MANTKSALKRIRTSAKRHERNQAVKSATRTHVKKARTAITRDVTEAQTDLLVAISALDRAAKKGVIHRNNAARRKSRLMKLYNASLPVEAPAEAEPEPAKPARGRGSNKKSAATKATAAKATAAKATAAKDEAGEEKPAPKRRTRKTTAES
jgi:small subunit ribosomal protein S20